MLRKTSGHRQPRPWPVALALLSALCLWVILPWGQALEEGVGLDTLFYLRGEREPPPGVAIVAINENTAAALGLPAQLVNWPRSVYAELVERLSSLQVKLIVFDVFFKTRGEQSPDKQFATAMKQAQNVILFAFTGREVHELGDQQVLVDRIAEPLAPLQQSALATAPFLLPKVSSKVTRYWIRWAGHPPRWTLPAAALLHQAANPEAAEAGLAALNNAQVYNYYGPPRTITTLGLEEVLANPQQFRHLLSDAVVFVGYSARHQPGQKDGFYTPFTAASGLDISGVELAATAFANLREGSRIRHHRGVWLLVTLLYGGCLLLAGLRLPFAYGLALMLLLAVGYGALVLWLFTHIFYWLPLLAPLLLLTPMAVLLSAWHRLQVVAEQKQRLETAFGHYLPAAEIRRLASQPERFAQRQALFGVCLVTDAQGYTRVAERVGSLRLSDIMEQYYAAVIPPIRAQGGIISDVAGDGVIAIWSDVPVHSVWATIGPVLQSLQASVDGFNRQHPDSQLPTRVGVHAGDVVLGNFGASDHFEYRAIGDLVNTTSRIENACKSLGVSVLVSTVCTAPAGHDLRYLGEFLLQGKQQPLGLMTLLAAPWSGALQRRFEQALEQLGAGLTAAARSELADLRRETADPVCDFYLRYGDSKEWHFSRHADGGIVVELNKS
ncbi:MAG: adenylate/guanylate cyclase domain-containing protein [Gammaproteobacteria bacterium]|nr:adenylate/guanylate cyclase domain-containing protein [Gammaproteobacteria bacterium]